jgi:hypothetical protein
VYTMISMLYPLWSLTSSLDQCMFRDRLTPMLCLLLWSGGMPVLLPLPIDIESLQNRLLRVGYVPTTSTGLNRLFSFLLLRPLTVLMKETRQAIRAIKQSILLRCLWLDPK